MMRMRMVLVLVLALVYENGRMLVLARGAHKHRRPIR